MRGVSSGVRQRAFLFVVLAGLGIAPPSSATTLPPGFVEELLVDGLHEPMSMALGV